MHSSIFFLIIWLIVVFILSVIPVPDTKIKTELPFDKIVHFVLYGITAILFFRTFRLWLWKKGNIIFFSVISSFFCGLLFEFVQMFLPYRSFSLTDIGANTLGAIIFATAYYFKHHERIF